MSKWFGQRNRRHRVLQSGQGLLEYALILVLVAIVVVVLVSNVGRTVSNVFQNVTCNLDNPANCGTPVAVVATASNGTGTPSGSNSPTPTVTGTQTVIGTTTTTATATATVTLTSTSVVPTAIPTNTPIPTAIPTSTPVPTAIPTNTPIPTAIPTSTPLPTSSGGSGGSGSGGGAGSGNSTVVPSSTPSNVAPSMNSVSPQTLNEGQKLSVAISATDANGDTLTYSATGLTSTFMTFTDNGNGTATLTLAPSYGHAGTYSVYVSVGDGRGGLANQTIQITVTNVVLDTDGDGVEDAVDNCPANANPGQEDWDSDGIGDVCDGEYHLRFGSSNTVTGSNGITYKPFTATAGSGGTIYAVTPTSITGITDPAVCQTLVESRNASSTGKDLQVNFSAASSLPGGNYQVSLYFAESRNTNQGEFDISIEGNKLVSKYLPNLVGYKVAHIKVLSAQAVTNGTLNVLLGRTGGIPSLCAMDIVKQ